MQHITQWLNQIATFRTGEGRDVEVWALNHQQDQAILSAWAKHFREQYCPDGMLDGLMSGTGLTKNEFLTQIIFPDQHSPPGPSTRAGDFGELLVSDYLEYSLNYWVPRFRMQNKVSRNESVKGCDVIGFQFANVNRIESPNDQLVIYECKATLSETLQPPGFNRLQDAVNDSVKDKLRKAESLNFLKRKLKERNDQSALWIERFQNPEDRPFTEINGAVAILSTAAFNQLRNNLQTTVGSTHPNYNRLRLLVIYGNDLMSFAHNLFQRAANEA